MCVSQLAQLCAITYVVTQCLNLASLPLSSVDGTKTQVKEVSEGNVENNLGEIRSTHSCFPEVILAGVYVSLTQGVCA